VEDDPTDDARFFQFLDREIRRNAIHGNCVLFVGNGKGVS
jgi:hypothetical protein